MPSKLSLETAAAPLTVQTAAQLLSNLHLQDRGEGACDAVIDTAGLPETISNVRDGGQFLSITDNEQPEPEREITPRKCYVEEDGAQLAAIAEQLADGTLTVPLCRTYPLSNAAAAHAAFEQGSLRGKLLPAP